MTDQQLQDIADRIIQALENLAPGAPAWWAPWAAFGSYAALLAAGVAFLVGWLSIRQQKKALAAQIENHQAALTQKSEADARAEWWRRTQWALEASASGNPMMYAYGTGILDLLAKSELAGPQDKRMLDAVWEGTSTEMKDESIERLIEDAKDLGNLSYEELLSLVTFDSSTFDRFQALQKQGETISYDDLLGMLRAERTDDAGGESSARSMDGMRSTEDNEGNKEADDGNPENLRSEA